MGYKLGALAAALVATIGAPQTSLAQEKDITRCHGLAKDPARLICYDRLTGYEPAPAETAKKPSEEELVETSENPSAVVKNLGQQWSVIEEESKLDGRTDVFLHTASTNNEPNQIGSSNKARLWLRCMNNTTNLFVTFDQYVSDAQTVKYRLDDGPVRSIWMSPMNGGDGIGIWSGGKAIPMIKGMIDKSEMTLSYDAYSRNNMEFTFNIAGLKAKLESLATACHWRL